MPHWDQCDGALNMQDLYDLIVSLFTGNSDMVPSSPEWAEDTLNFYDQ